jgi:hypothetical protein
MTTIHIKITFASWLALLTILAVVACSTTPTKPLAGQLIESDCPAVGGDGILEPGSIGASRTSDEWLRSSYSALLNQIDATAFWCGAREPEAYRLIVLPTSAPALVVIATRLNDGWEFVFSEYEKGPRPQSVSAGFRLSRQGERVVDDAAVKPLQDALARSGLWTQRLLYAPEGADGVVWSIEGRRDGRYSVISQTRGRDDDFAAAARLLIQLSGSSWQ